jgi:hypothetical protein
LSLPPPPPPPQPTMTKALVTIRRFFILINRHFLSVPPGLVPALAELVPGQLETLAFADLRTLRPRCQNDRDARPALLPGANPRSGCLPGSKKPAAELMVPVSRYPHVQFARPIGSGAGQGLTPATQFLIERHCRVGRAG